MGDKGVEGVIASLVLRTGVKPLRLLDYLTTKNKIVKS